MPNKCVVDGCTSTPQNASLHRFPRGELLLQKWNEAIKKPAEWFPIENERVCSLHFDPTVVTRSGSKVRLLECAIPRTAVYQQDHQTETSSLDHEYALPSAATLKRRLDVLVDKVETDDKNRKNVNRRETRLRQSISSIINDLKEQRFVNEEMEAKLQAFSDIPTDLFNRPANEYTDEQKDFARTLHMYSGKA